jgi:hypothetical protein
MQNNVTGHESGADPIYCAATALFLVVIGHL